MAEIRDDQTQMEVKQKLTTDYTTAYTADYTTDCFLAEPTANYTDKDKNAIMIITERKDLVSNESFADSVIFNLKSNHFTRRKITDNDKKLEINGACSVMYRGMLFVYGGTPLNQILSFTCDQKKLEHKGTLRFDFNEGSCASNNHLIMLCFTNNAKKKCYKSKYPVPKNSCQWFTPTEESHYEHSMADVAMTSGKRLTVRLFFDLSKLFETFHMHLLISIAFDSKF